MENRYVDPGYSGPWKFEGYLKKLKSKNAYSRIFSKFNKRFFVVDLNQYFFGYKKNANSEKIRKFSLVELIYLDSSPKIIETCDWKFAFAVKFNKRLYTLHSESYKDCKQWCEILTACMKPLERSLYNTFEKSPPPNIFQHSKVSQELTQTPKFQSCEKSKAFTFSPITNDSPQHKVFSNISNISNPVPKVKTSEFTIHLNENDENFYSFQNSPVSIHSFGADLHPTIPESKETLIIERLNKSSISRSTYSESSQIKTSLLAQKPSKIKKKGKLRD